MKSAIDQIKSLLEADKSSLLWEAAMWWSGESVRFGVWGSGIKTALVIYTLCDHEKITHPLWAKVSSYVKWG